jgi:hypothetical protein
MRHLLQLLPATGIKYRKINKFEHNEVRDKHKTDAKTEYSPLTEAVVMMRVDFLME